jgi:hypothetical protein
MSQAMRTALTLGLMLVLLAVGVVVGWSKLTEPLPRARDGGGGDPRCLMTRVEAGTKIYPDMVVVSVFNAGTRSGLAGTTMERLVTRGFGVGTTGNAPREEEVPVAQVWTADPKDSAARLVRSHLGRSTIVRKPEYAIQGSGVMVVVGNGFKKLGPGRKSVQAKEAVTLCSPPPPTG